MDNRIHGILALTGACVGALITDILIYRHERKQSQKFLGLSTTVSVYTKEWLLAQDAKHPLWR